MLFAWYTEPSLSCFLLFYSASPLQLLPCNLMLLSDKMSCSFWSDCAQSCLMTLSTFFLSLDFHIHSFFKYWLKYPFFYKACQTNKIVIPEMINTMHHIGPKSMVRFFPQKNRPQNKMNYLIFEFLILQNSFQFLNDWIMTSG